MKRSILLVLPLLAASLAAYAQQDQSAEQTITSFMQELPKHALKLDDESKAFWMKYTAPKVTNVDSNGQLNDGSMSEMMAAAEQILKANPGVKMVVSFSDIKIRVYGDMAIVTYLEDQQATGFKDKRYDQRVKARALDTWQRLSGQWKSVATTNTPVEPLPAEAYKLPSLMPTEQQ